MWVFILKNWKIFLISFAVLAVLSALFAYGTQKYRKGYQAAQAVCEQAAKDALDRGINIDTKQKNVVRPGSTALALSMRDGSF